MTKKAGPDNGDQGTAAKMTLTDWRNQIAAVITRGRKARTMTLHPLAAGTRSRTYRAECAGRDAVVKIFDNPGTSRKTAYRHESRALAALKGQAMVCRHLAHCDAGSFVITGTIPGSGLDQVIDADSVQDWAFRIGVWLADYEAVAPSEKATGNWLSYLRRLGLVTDRPEIRAHTKALELIPLCGLSLARCDGALSNFIVTKGDALVGIDFENATMRPRGWDFLVTFEALVQRFPGEAEDILHAMTDGFESRHMGSLIADELASLARVYLLCRMFGETADTGGCHVD